MAEYNKPLPLIDFDSQEYWNGCKRHELLVQRCKNCRKFRFPPDPACRACASLDSEWIKVSGKGKIYTYTITTQAVLSAFREVPYAIVLVELDDVQGVRVVSNIVDCKPDDIYIGMPVEVVFDDVTDDVTLPKFKPVTKYNDRSRND